MTSYPKSAYGSNPNAGKSPNGAQGRGWGTGWPNCQASKMVKVVSDAGHFVNVRREIGQLVATLFQIQLVRGYDPNPGTLLQTWGFACRAIANTKRASNHSWGLAIDNRATENPYSTTFRSTIPPKVVNDWEVCGFYWGGRYTTKYDTMHFEYIGTPSQVAGHLAKAKAILKSLTPTSPPVQPPEPDMPLNQADKDFITGECQRYAVANNNYTRQVLSTATKAILDEINEVDEETAAAVELRLMDDFKRINDTIMAEVEPNPNP